MLPIYPAAWEFRPGLSEEPFVLPWYPQGSGSGKASRGPSSSGSEGSGVAFIPLRWSLLLKTFALSMLAKSRDPWESISKLCKWPAVSAEGNTGIRTKTADISCNVSWEIPGYYAESSEPTSAGVTAPLFPAGDTSVYACITCMFCRRKG